MRAGLLIIGVCLTGCPGQDPANPDSGIDSDSSSQLDGSSGEAKLRLEWSTTPVIPGLTTLGHRLDEVRFRMENLKATVDVDPNDPNTTRDEVKLRWIDEESPEVLTLDDVPAGRYTSIVMKLDEGDGEDSFEIRGLSNESDTFKFEDTASLSISMGCNIVLSPGETKTLIVDIDLQTVVDAVDIESLGSNDGVDHYLDDDDVPAVTQLRSTLQAAFSVREK